MESRRSEVHPLVQSNGVTMRSNHSGKPLSGAISLLTPNRSPNLSELRKDPAVCRAQEGPLIVGRPQLIAEAIWL